MEPLTLDAFEDQAASFDALIARTPEIDHFCSTTDWILAARAAWRPRTPVWIRRGDAGQAIFLAQRAGVDGLELQSLDTMWGFGCPLAGAAPVPLVDALAGALEEEPGLRVVEIAGVVPRSQLWHAVTRRFHGRHELYASQPMRRWQADLDEGLDAWLARRSTRFRRGLRHTLSLAEREGVEVERVRDVPAENAAVNGLLRRIKRVERHSWKGRSGTGLISRDLMAFYRQMCLRVCRRGALRALFARREGRDVGYILGAVRGGVYRGFQLSYAQELARLSLGNLLQFRQLEQLIEEGIGCYDLGMDMGYKERWADRAMDTVRVVLVPA